MSSANVIDNADPLLRIPPKALQPKTHKEIRGLKKILLHRYYQHHASRDEKSYIYKKWKKIKEVQNQPTHAEPPFLTTSKDSRSIEDFECLNKVDEGTFGVVIRARDKLTDDIVALKLLKHLNEREGFSVAAQRELNTLLNIQHPNIVAGRDIAVGSTKDNVYIVMEYVPHQLKTFLETMRLNNLIFFPEHVKCLMTQLLKAVQHLHDNHIIHRDLKTANILLSQDGVLKVADFGLAREYGFPLQQYTPGVCTLWYRAPELLLLSPEYYSPVDMWSVGCIFAELVILQPLFPATSEVDLLRRIFMDLGTPSDTIWPGYSSLPPLTNIIFENYPPGGLRKKLSREVFSDSGLSLLEGLLTYYPARRVTAAAALEHAYFKEQPVAIEPARFPISLQSHSSGNYFRLKVRDRGSYYNTPVSALENDENIIEITSTSIATESF